MTPAAPRRRYAARQFLPNGSARLVGPSQVPEADQHRQRALQLPIQVDLVSGRRFQPVSPVSSAECLLSDGVPVFKLRDRFLEPFVPVAIDPSLQRLCRRYILRAVARRIVEAFEPGRTGVLPKRCQRVRVRIRTTLSEDIPSLSGHGLIALYLPEVTRRVTRIAREGLRNIGLAARCSGQRKKRCDGEMLRRR